MVNVENTDTTAIAEYENRCSEVLETIRHFIDGLRSAPNFKLGEPVTNTEPTRSHTASKNWQQGQDCGDGSLMTHMNSIGVIQLVNRLHLAEVHVENVLETEFQSTLLNLNKDDEREQVLHQIVFPLLEKLEHNYAIIDEVLPSRPSTLPIAIQTSKKCRAPPPPGMLSLNDYTNVACLLEFTISLSLIPFMEYSSIFLPPILQSSNGGDSHFNPMRLNKVDLYSTNMIQKRSFSIPKSLAGRISKSMLTWGTLAAAASVENILHENFFISNELSITETFNSHQLYTIFHAYNEMTVFASRVGRLLLLDRFRPMLLPRHLSDVYLSLLIAERLKWYLMKMESFLPSAQSKLQTLINLEKTHEKQNNDSLLSLQMSLRFTSLRFPSSVVPDLPSTPSPPLKYVDCREAALAYRTLLSGGASMVTPSSPSPSIPPWLRIRIGQCLTQLAHEDIRAVVEVFVAMARINDGSNVEDANSGMSDDIMTGAALRLACALCKEPMGSTSNSTSVKGKLLRFQERLCFQFVSFLVAEGQSPNNSMHSRSSVAMHLTLWATIPKLTMDTLQFSFISELVSGMIPTEGEMPRLTAIQSVSALAEWLSMIPSSLDIQARKKVVMILFEPILQVQNSNLSVFGQCLRFSVTFSHDSQMLLSKRHLIEEIGETENGVISALEKAETALHQMLALLCSAESSRSILEQKDRCSKVSLELLRSLSSNDLDRDGFSFDVTNRKDSIVYRRREDAPCSEESSYLIGTVESRVKCLIRAFEKLSQVGEDSSLILEGSVVTLTSSLFQLALVLHYESFIQSTSDCYDQLINQNIMESKNLNAREALELKMVASITLATMSECCPPTFFLGASTKNDDYDANVLEVLGLIIKATADQFKYADKDQSEPEDAELFSTISIVLNVLIAILELGAKKRSLSDESFFESILPSLRTMSLQNMDQSKHTRFSSEVAEMASHAFALIITRGELTPLGNEELERGRKDAIENTILYKLSQAERDLQSTQPPIRAKGVVTLRHLARSIEFHTNDDQLDFLIGALKNKTLISDISEPDSKPLQSVSTEKNIALLSRTLAKICLNALADSESYVYLASIHTLVAIGDVCPSEIIPLVAVAVAKGEVQLTTVSSEAIVESVELILSSEQRVKATEALIFMIRRRGEGIFLHGSSLLSAMLFGVKQSHKEYGWTLSDDGQTAQLIQRETHLYFQGDEENVDMDSYEEKKLRLRTGGPIFSMEETDLVRAGAMSVVCTLVATLNPTIIELYSNVLVKMVTDIIQLDTSRPVRRAAALLARELYACVMREVIAHNGVNECAFSFAIAIVDANEDKMFHALTNCVTAGGMEKMKLIDPSTQRRCQEAIEIRNDLESIDILRLAAITLSERTMYPEILQKLRVHEFPVLSEKWVLSGEIP